MKVKKIITSTVELELDITGATLLTKEEAEQLPKRLREYHDYWWWLKLPLPGPYHNHTAVVDVDGCVYYYGELVDFDNAVRPALVISNLKSSEFKIGDKFEFGDKEFEIISDNRALCLTDIGRCAFRDDQDAEDASIYEKSDVKKFIDGWFEKAKIKEAERIANSKRMEQLVEEFIKWFLR